MVAMLGETQLADTLVWTRHRFSQCSVLIDIWYQDTMVPTQVDDFLSFSFSI